MQYFIFYKSHGLNVLFNFPILLALAGPGKETTTVYAKLISPETGFLNIFSNNHKSDTWLYSIVTWKYYSDKEQKPSKPKSKYTIYSYELQSHLERNL